MMLAVLLLRLKELLTFLDIDKEDDADGAGDAEERADAFLVGERRCFF